MVTPVVFDSKGQQVVGMFHLPEGRGRFPTALLMHGFTGTKTEIHRLFVKLSRALAQRGIASLRFDFRGSGDSDGDFEDMTVRSEIADAQEAIKFLAKQKRVNSRRLAMVGMSMGAAVASYVVARERHRIKSLALWAPVADGTGILDGLSTPEALTSLAETGITDYNANLVGMQFIRQFAEIAIAPCYWCTAPRIRLCPFIIPTNSNASSPKRNMSSKNSSSKAPITPSTDTSGNPASSPRQSIG